MTSTSHRSALISGRNVLTAIGLVGLHFGAAVLGLELARSWHQVSPVWPASGVAVWMALVYGPRAIVLVALSSIAVTFVRGNADWTSAALVAANVLEAGVAALLLRRVVRFRVQLDRPDDALGLIAIGGMLAPAVSATIGVGSLVLAGRFPVAQAFDPWRSWWAGNSIGVLVFTPVLLAWAPRSSVVRPRTARVELIALLVLALGVSLAAFGILRVDESLMFASRFALLPVLVWTGLRFTASETSLVVLVAGVTATLATFGRSVGLGVQDHREGEVVLQAFLGFVAGAGLLLSTVTSGMRRTERELREAFSLLSATLDSTADGILVVDLEGRIRTFNRRFGDLWRIPSEILLTRDDQRAIAFVLDQLRDPGGFLSKVEALYAHPGAESSDELEFKDGRIFERTSRPQYEGERVVGRVWCFRDVTKSRRLETELRQTQKMEAIGRLAGGVAHDFNNLLTVILGHCEMLLQNLRAEAPQRRDVTEIRDASQRAADLTRQLLAFSRRQVLSPRTLELNTIVRETSSMLRRLLPEGIELRTDLGTAQGGVRADPGQMQQVLLNLALNARDAMPDGGALTIRTYEVALEGGGTDGLDLPSGPYLVLSVSDTGAGMDEETRTHLFEPFFTTKEQGQGSGLGLATVYGIVRQSGGDIAVWSAPGEGSHFRVFLPRVGLGPDPLASPAEATFARRRATVMLVEDNPGVRRLLGDALRSAGYRVLEAAHGGDAAGLARETAEEIHALVTDVVMPGLGGPELADRLHAERRVGAVLFVTGYSDVRDLDVGAKPYPCELLQKPFTPQALTRALADLLDRAAPGTSGGASARRDGDERG